MASGLRVKSSYSLFFFIFFWFIALTLTVLPLHWKALGFSEFEIAIVSAAGNIASITGPLILTFVSHRWIGPRLLIIASAVAAAILFLPLAWAESFKIVLLFWFLALVFNSGVLSLTSAGALFEAEEKAMNYGRVRLWGSIGFVLASYIFGLAVDWNGTGIVSACGLAVLTATAAAAFLLRGAFAPEIEAKEERSLRATVKVIAGLLSKPLLLLMLVVMAQWISHAALYTYFSLHLQNLGWSATLISTAWIVGVAAEILMLYFYDQIEKRLSLPLLFRLSILFTAARWLILWQATTTAVVLAVTTLHGFSYASFHVGSMKLTHRLVPEEFKNLGQALLMAFGGGAGTLLGRLMAGALAQRYAEQSGYFVLFLVSAAVAVIAWLLSAKLCFSNPAEENQ